MEPEGPGCQELLFKGSACRSGRMNWGRDAGCLIGPRLTIIEVGTSETKSQALPQTDCVTLD